MKAVKEQEIQLPKRTKTKKKKKKKSKMKKRTKSNNINTKGPRLRKLTKIFLNHNYHRLRSSSEGAMLCLSSSHKKCQSSPPS